MSEPGLSKSDRTRRAILDAARNALHEQGTGAAIGSIALAAGVSKGGLLHHFPSRDDLLLAVAQDSIQRFRAHVSSLVDLSENHPGKLLRAYVRALVSNTEESSSQNDYPGLWTTLRVIPGVPELLREDADYWRRNLAGDGLHPDRILLVEYAAEGFVASLSWDVTLDHTSSRRLLDLLIGISDNNGPLVEA